MSFRLCLLMFLFSMFAAGGPAATGADKNCVPPKSLGHQQGPQGTYSLKEGAIAIISVRITKKGQASDPKLVQSSGDRNYDRDAVDEARRWQFEPFTCKDKPSDFQLEVTMRYDPTPQVSH
jgi:TonB family protein